MKAHKSRRTVNRDFVAIPAKKTKAPVADHSPDRYDVRENAGSAFAAAVLAWQNPKYGVMPVPPPRIVAALKAKRARAERRSA